MAYAILGATGKTGSSILTLLLHRPGPVKINLYVRSRAKLLAETPSLSSNPSATIFEGPLTNISLITNCIKDTTAVFLTVAVNDNVPNCTVARDTAGVVLAALEQLRQRGQRLPKLVMLSAAAIDDTLMRSVPRPVTSILRAAFSHLYADLTAAESLLRSQDGLDVVFVKPGALVHDAQKGHVLSVERAGAGCLSYMDLAAGMIEIAEDGDGKWEGRNVSVVATGKGVKVEWKAPYFLLRGLLFHFLPAAYRWLK